MLILGISANFVLDFVHVALKGIIINAEVSSLKTSFSYEAPLLLLAPYAPRVIASSPRSYSVTSLLHCNIFVIRTMTTTTAKSKVKPPKNSIPKKESHSLLPAAAPRNTKPKARNNSQPARRKPTSPASSFIRVLLYSSRFSEPAADRASSPAQWSGLYRPYWCLSCVLRIVSAGAYDGLKHN